MGSGNELSSKYKRAPITNPHAEIVYRVLSDHCCKMYLMYYLDAKGERVYTFNKVAPDGTPTASAHPAKFSPEDKYSRERILIKKRFGILPTQLPPLKY